MNNLNLKIISTLFFVLILFTELIPNLGAVDKIGPQWFYLSIINLLILLYHLFKTKTDFLDLFKNKVNLSYLIFLLICSLSIFFAQNVLESINYISRFFIIFLTFVNFQILTKGLKQIYIIWIISIIFFVEGLLIFNQFIEIYEFGKDFGRNSKLIGAAANINIAGFSIAMFLPFAINLQNNLKGIKKLIIIILIFISVFSAFLTGSRGTILSITIIFIAYTILFILKEKQVRNKLKKISFILIPFVFSIIITEVLFDSMRYSYRINQIVERGSDSRIKYYEDAFESIKERPLIGVGIGNWKINSIEKGKRHIEGYIVPYHAHNDFIQLFAEIGIIGLITYLMIYIFALSKPILNLFKKHSPVLFCCLLFFVVYALDSNLNFPIARPIIQIKWALILAIILNNEEH